MGQLVAVRHFLYHVTIDGPSIPLGMAIAVDRPFKKSTDRSFNVFNCAGQINTIAFSHPAFVDVPKLPQLRHQLPEYHPNALDENAGIAEVAFRRGSNPPQTLYGRNQT